LVYCINGSRTRQAEPVFYTHGVDNGYHLAGTFQAWIQSMHPVEKDGVKKVWLAGQDSMRNQTCLIP
jgi:hypothetical protein